MQKSYLFRNINIEQYTVPVNVQRMRMAVTFPARIFLTEPRAAFVYQKPHLLFLCLAQQVLEPGAKKSTLDKKGQSKWVFAFGQRSCVPSRLQAGLSQSNCRIGLCESCQ